MASDYSRPDTIKAVKSRLEALIDTTSHEFLQAHKHVQPELPGLLHLEWLFDDRYAGFPSSAYSAVEPLPKDISVWSDHDLDLCSASLARNSISIRASLNKAVVQPIQAAPTVAENRRDRKEYQILRIRLKSLIESTIGREVFQRTGHPINYIKSDPEPPNGFIWLFSDEYPEFAFTALSEFRLDDVEACNKALDKGWLRVARADTTTQRSDRSESVSNGAMARETMIKTVRETVLKIIAEVTGENESVEDVQEILTQRSIIMEGLSWRLSNGYQFPFGVSEEFNSKKLQLTNWSNSELEDTLRGLDNGNIKLVRDPSSRNTIPHDERLLRKKDRPRRPRDSVGMPPSLSTSRRRPTHNHDSESIITVQQNNAMSGENIPELFGQLDDDQKLHTLKELFEVLISRKQTALHQAQSETMRLQGTIDSKDRQIEAQDKDIRNLHAQLHEASEQKAQALAKASEAATKLASIEKTDGEQKVCVTCHANSLLIQELRDKNSKNMDRILVLYDQQRDLDTLLKAKTRLLKRAKKQGFTESSRTEVEDLKGGSGRSDSFTANGDGDKHSEYDTTDSEDDQPLKKRLHRREPKTDSTLLANDHRASKVPTSSTFLPRVPARHSLPNSVMSTQVSNPRSDFAFEERFSKDFLRHLTGGNSQVFSSPREGTTIDKRSFTWEKLIMIDLACQPSAPKAANQSGMIYLVDGEPYSNNTHGIYPAVLSTDGGESYSYLGNLDVTVTAPIPLPLFEWANLSSSVQLQFAKHILTSPWGNQLLLNKGLLPEMKSTQIEGKIADVLGFFSRRKEPNLRLRRYASQWAFPSDPDYKDLCAAAEIFRGQDQMKKRKREV